MSYNNGPKIVTSGLVLYVDAANSRSYPSSGTVWTDISRNGLDGTLTNGPTFNSSNGGSIVFDGTNDYVNFGNSSVFNQSGGKSFTITCWAFFAAASQSHNPIFNKAATNGTFEYTLGLSSTATPQWLTSVNGTSYVLPTVSETISLNTWYYYTAGFNNATQLAFVSINAGQVYTVSQTGIYNGTRAFEVGRHNDPVTTMNGRVSNLLFYNRALSASEVRQNYNATKGRFGL